MGYVIESQNEGRRLELQAEINAYSLDLELGNLNIVPGSMVLDAGCGHGMVSRFLNSHYDINLESFDLSSDRIELARSFNTKDVTYSVANAENIPYQDFSFDYIFSRYLFEYLPNPVKACQELFRVAKYGSEVFIIDLDGVFCGLKTDNKQFNEKLNYLCANIPVDLNVGHKISDYLQKTGFNVEDVKITDHMFSGDDLFLEQENNIKRIKQARPFITGVLGDFGYQKFLKEYSDYMVRDGSLYSFKKYIIKATKNE